MGDCSGLEAAGFVLAGGQSRRMGTDKALVKFGGRPLIAHAVEILAAAGLPVFIAGVRGESRARLETYAPVIPDREAGLGPLGGVCTALASTTAGLGVILTVDAPLLPAALIAYLLWRARVTEAAITLASVNGFPQTFPAVVAQKALPALEREIGEGRLGCLAGFVSAAREVGERVSMVAAEMLAQSGKVLHPEARPVVRWFANLNTAEEVRSAWWRGTSRVS